MATTVAYSYTGPNVLINALIEDGYKWSSGSTVTTLSYAFASTPAHGDFTWTAIEKAAVAKDAKIIEQANLINRLTERLVREAGMA